MTTIDLDEMLATTGTVSDDATLAAEYIALGERIALATERRDEILTILGDRHTDGTYPAGPYKVVVGTGPARLNKARFEAAYPIAQHSELYSATADVKKIKAHLAPVIYDGFYDAGKPSVKVS